MSNGLLFVWSLVAGGSGAWLLHEASLAAGIAFAASVAMIVAHIRKVRA